MRRIFYMLAASLIGLCFLLFPSKENRKEAKSDKNPEAETRAWQQQEGNDIYVRSPGLIAALTREGLIDEYQICIHPVVAGKGLPLFRDLSAMVKLKLIRTKMFKTGAVLLCYLPQK